MDSGTKSGRHVLKSIALVGRNAAASSSSRNPRSCASGTRLSGCRTPEKLD